MVLMDHLVMRSSMTLLVHRMVIQAYVFCMDQLL